VISDFQKLLSSSEQKTTAHAVGTGPYLPPELFDDCPYSFEIDIWSLDCILYELLTFQKPFIAVKEILNEPVPEVTVDYLAELKSLIYSMLKKMPEELIKINEI
jgi:serine/threonine protein kinase